MSNFDEKSGTVASVTPWGSWWQTRGEVWIEVNVPKGTRGKNLSILLSPKRGACKLSNETIFQGEWCDTIKEEESTWTLEDQCLVRMQLVKVEDTNAWRSLLKEQYAVDPLTFNEMRKKLDLEKFQIDNPGFDFSGAELTKTYDVP